MMDVEPPLMFVSPMVARFDSGACRGCGGGLLKGQRAYVWTGGVGGVKVYTHRRCVRSRPGQGEPFCPGCLSPMVQVRGSWNVRRNRRDPGELRCTSCGS